MTTLTQLESELPYPIDVEIIDYEGSWFLVYNASEGFQPLLYAIMTDSADDAAEIWAHEPRNHGVDAEETLVVIPLTRTLRTFTVTWEIEVDAYSPRGAARIARRIQRDADSAATCFSVFASDRELPQVIDLADDEEDA